jgi:hypothetical protein
MNDKIIHKIKGYLGYDVLCSITLDNNPDITYPPSYLDVEYKNIWEASKWITSPHFPNVESVKLHLRPLEDLTDEECEYLYNKTHYIITTTSGTIDYNSDLKDYLISNIKKEFKEDTLSLFISQYLNSIHIDYQNLIGNLAIKKELK